MQCPRRSESWVGQSKTFARDDDTSENKLTCDYCGSMLEDQFMAAIERGEELGPTDKNYKVYVSGTKKFYFQHLSKENQLKFIELYNDKTMRIGHPGFFYVKPFFCK